MTLQRHDPAHDDVRWLQHRPLWQELPDDDLERLASLGEHRRIPEGQILASAPSGEEILLIVVGDVSVSRAGSVIAWLGPGDTVGGLAMFDQTPLEAEVRATSPTELLALDGRRLDAMVLADIQTMRTRVMEAAAHHHG